MNGYNFTERVRKVLAMSREEAARLHHEYVGTEHMLLGIIREGEGVAAAVLQSLTIDLEELQEKIEDTVKSGKSHQGTGPDLPYTSRAKKVLEFAMSEARELNHSYVGTEHLLLGLLREEKGIAAQVLNDAGLSLADARTEVLRILGTDPGASRADTGHQPWLAQEVSRERNDRSPRTAMHDDGSIQAGRWARSLTPQRWTSDRAHAVISRARADAAQRRSRYIEPEHLLLAILEEDGGMAAMILERLAIDRVALTRAATGALEETVATQSEIMELDITFSTPARAVMRDAFHEARVTRDRVSTDHLLLGLLIEAKCAAARVLADAGLTAHAIRKQRERIAG
jgi:ATP-dependent Clp protease ATP-binding subunit ClpA